MFIPTGSSSATRSCLRQSMARHDLQQNGTARCNLISLSPCGLRPNRSEPNRTDPIRSARRGPPSEAGGGCPRKRSGWKGDRAGYSSGGAFPVRAASFRPDPTRPDTTPTNSFCTCRLPAVSGRERLPAKAEWPERRQGWPLQWRRLSFPGSLLPPHASCSWLFASSPSFGSRCTPQTTCRNSLRPGKIM